MAEITTERPSTYQGWTNYETWAVNLWISNDQGSEEYWGAIALECWEDAPEIRQVRERTWTREEAPVFLLADRLKSEFEEGKDNLLDETKQSSSVWADLLGAALSEVNWQEIARHMIDDVDKSGDE